MTRGDAAGLEPLPASRTCTLCGAPTRFSHAAYAGRGEEVPVHVCTRCGTAYRGASRSAAEARASRDAVRRRVRERRRPLPEGGSPDNPVLDEETARRLRETFGDV